MSDTQPIVQLDLDQLQTLFSNAILETTKRLGMDAVDRKHGVFPETTAEELASLTKEERLRRWLRAVYTKDPAELLSVKALAEGTGSAGGFLVPDEFRADVIRVAELAGVARREAFVFPVATDQLLLTAANGSVSVSWTGEGQQIPTSDPSFSQPTLTVKKAAGITAMSNELFADSKFPVVRYLAELFGEAIAAAEDEQAFNGPGTVFYGMLSVPGGQTKVSTATSYKQFTIEELLDLIMLIAPKYRIGAKFYMNHQVFSYIRRLKDDTGNYIVQSPRDATQPSTIWGYPVVEVERMPSEELDSTAYIGFGNMRRRCYFADRQQMAIAIGTEGTVGADNLFEKDMSAVRVTERIGILWTLPAGVSRLATPSL